MKIVIRILLIGYILIGLGSMIRLTIVYDYVTIDSYNYVMFHHWFILLIAAVLLLLFFIYLIKRNILEFKPTIKSKTIAKIISIPLVIILFFFLNTGCILFIDYCLPNRDVLHLNGIVMNKRFEWEQRRSARTKVYFLSVSDTITTQNYYFQVKKFIYDKYKINDVFVKDFNVSRLGMIYRKEE